MNKTEDLTQELGVKMAELDIFEEEKKEREERAFTFPFHNNSSKLFEFLELEEEEQIKDMSIIVNNNVERLNILAHHTESDY